MRKINKLGIFSSILFFLMSSFVSIGKSSWTTATIEPEDLEGTLTPVKKEPVAKYSYNNEDKYFATIESAVNSANSASSSDKIEVRALVSAGTITITSSFTINSNISLVIPYSDTENTPMYKKVNKTIDETDSDSIPEDFYSQEKFFVLANYDSVTTTCNKVNVYANFSSACKLNVVVNSGVTITNNGSLYIGGIQSGSGGGHIAGFICSSFAKMTFKGNASIQSNGLLVNFGYIVGETVSGQTPSITSSSGSSTYVPFVLTDYLGGSNLGTLARGDQNQNLKGAPFNRFYFPSFINVNHRFVGNASLYAIPDLYTGAKSAAGVSVPARHNRCMVKLIGSLAIFTPSTNFSLNNLFNFETTAATGMPKHNLTTYGNFTLSYMSLTLNVPVLGEVDMNTSSIYFPISCYYNIEIKNANGASSSSVSLGSQKIKCLYGSRVVIDNNVTVTSPGIVVYSAGDATNGLTGKGATVAYEKSNSAEFVVKGTLSTSIGCGYFDTSGTNGSITINNCAETVYEVDPTKVGTYTMIFVTIIDSGADYYAVNFFNATGPVSNSAGDLVSSELPTGQTITGSSLGDRWNIVLGSHLEKVTLTSANGSYASGANAAATFTLNATVTPADPDDLDESYGYQWSVSGSGGTLSSNTGQSVTLSTTANSNSSDATVTVTVTVKNTDGVSFSDSKEFTRTKKASSGGSCLLPDALVMLADGSVKKTKDITKDDWLISYNHFTGEYEPQRVIFSCAVGDDLFNISKLTFSNGKEIEVVSGHGFFNLTNCTYEIYYTGEFENHIGEEFATTDYINGQFVTVPATLVKVENSIRHVTKYTPLTEHNINVVAEGILTIADDIEGMLDSYSYIGMNIDTDQLQRDIDTYGVYSYEDVRNVVPEYIFDVFNFKYWKIFIAKGTLTYDKVNYWIGTYVPAILAESGIEWDFEHRELLSERHG